VPALTLTSPTAGGTDVPIKGIIFTWNSVSGATYDFSLKDAAGTTVKSETGLTSASYGPVDLSYDTSYTWQVTAKKDGAVVAESDVATFRTVAEFPPPSPAAGTPAWVWAVIAIGAVLVIVVVVLIFRTRRV
jgi:hypothetical protein